MKSASESNLLLPMPPPMKVQSQASVSQWQGPGIRKCDLCRQEISVHSCLISWREIGKTTTFSMHERCCTLWSQYGPLGDIRLEMSESLIDYDPWTPPLYRPLIGNLVYELLGNDLRNCAVEGDDEELPYLEPTVLDEVDGSQAA